MGDGIAAGVRGLDFTAMVSEPPCGPPAANRGDEVNKVEPPRCDYSRTAA